MDEDVPDSELAMQVMENLEQFRELVRGLVAQYRTDGFTDEQSRAIVTFQITGLRSGIDGAA